MAIHRYNPGHQPPATLALVALIVLVAAVDLFNNGLLERALWARGLDVHYGQWWRIPGSALVHGSLMHLAFNAYGIWVLGRVLEQLQGPKAVWLIFWVSALGGAALGTILYDPLTPMLGASGGAYGMLGAVLGWFYVKTGSVRGIWQVPMGRQLAIWFLVGVGISFMPGISLWGHLGGFIPGALLGIYFELRYARRVDLYHHLSAGLLVAGVLAACVYAAVPVNRGAWHAARALAAYERGELEAGDAMLAEARNRRLSEGGDALVRHLRLWREGNALNPVDFDNRVLRWPLTHLKTDPALTYGAFGLLTPEHNVRGDALASPADEQ